MDLTPDRYIDVVNTYIDVIRRDSAEAAEAISAILANFGLATALRATLVITLVKIEVQKNRAVEDVSVHAYLVKDFPEAWPLLEQAIASCLTAWGVPVAEPLDMLKVAPTSADEENTASAPELPPL